MGAYFPGIYWCTNNTHANLPPAPGGRVSTDIQLRHATCVAESLCGYLCGSLASWPHTAAAHRFGFSQSAIACISQKRKKKIVSFSKRKKEIETMRWFEGMPNLESYQAGWVDNYAVINALNIANARAQTLCVHTHHMPPPPHTTTQNQTISRGLRICIHICMYICIYIYI